MLHSRVRVWETDPVTQRLLELLRENREANNSELLNSLDITQDNLGKIAYLKGRINALDDILDLESLFDGEFRDE